MDLSLQKVELNLSTASEPCGGSGQAHNADEVDVPAVGDAVSPQVGQAQHEVQRLLGRCMLRLQQYELLLKAVVALCDVESRGISLGAEVSSRAEERAPTTLGLLAKALFKSVVLPQTGAIAFSGTEQPEVEEGPPQDAVSIRIRSQLEMPPQKYEATKAAVKELVDMRNELAHHFIQRFDLWTSAGCLAGNAHLSACYETIDKRFVELSRWADAIDDARKEMVSFMQTTQFTDFFVNGIGPDGVVSWIDAGIVRCLREAECLRARDGWTNLDQAVKFVAEKYPEQVPEKYGCRGWRHLLHESGAFKLNVRNDGGEQIDWYRSRTMSKG